MQNISPEQLAGLTAGATPTQIMILILLGIAVCSLIFWIVINLIKLYINPIMREVESSKVNQKTLNDINFTLGEIKKSLWSKEDIKEKIEKEITEHALQCPYRNQKGK